LQDSAPTGSPGKRPLKRRERERERERAAAATDLRKVAHFIEASATNIFVNLMVKIYENWSGFSKVIANNKVIDFFLRHGVLLLHCVSEKSRPLLFL